MTRKQIIATMGLMLLGAAGQTVLLVREVNASLAQIEKNQDRILDRLQDIEKQIDWTGR